MNFMPRSKLNLSSITNNSKLSQVSHLFFHGCHASNSDNLSDMWVGQTSHGKSIEAIGSLTRLNIIDAINLSQIASVIVKRYEKVNSDYINILLKELRSQHLPNLSIHLVLDDTAYH